MTKILVTGVTGFTGECVLRYLADKFGKQQVIGTGRNEQKVQSLISQGFQIITVDLCHTQQVLECFKEINTIIHCAAKSSPWGTYASFYKDNVLATQNLLDLPQLSKIIYISTPSIYFDYSDRLNIKESDKLPAKMVNHYATTKYMAEQEVLNFNKKDLTAIVLRPRAIIGAGDTTIMPRVIKAYEKGKLKIIGNGNNLADFTSVKNLAHAVYLAIVTNENVHKGIFNITDGNPQKLWPLLQDTLLKIGLPTYLKKVPYTLAYTVAGFAELYARFLSNKEPSLTRYGVGILKYSLTLNIENAKTLLGYTPIITTEESIKEFIEKYMNEK